MTIYDAVVLGAGPSGSTAAKYLAEAGLTVCVLEKDTFPRDKPCGGALRPSIISEFDYVRAGIQKIPHTKCMRVKMYPPSLENFVDYYPKKVVMYNIQRKHFDTMLANSAKDKGAELFENEHVKKVIPKNGGYALLTRNGKEFEGKVIIGAGGMYDPVARYLRKKEGLSEKWPESDIGLAVVEEYEVDDDFILEKYGPERTCYFHLKLNNLYGYAWAFSKKNILNIGYGAFWKDMKMVDIKGQFSEYLKFLKKEKLIPNNIKPKNPKGAPIPLRGPIKTTYSHRILIIGDAAGFVSPVGGDGIYFSISSGKIAAEVVKDAIEHDSFGKDTLVKYQQKWYNEWGRDLEVLCYFADRMFKKTEQLFKYAKRDSVFRNLTVALYNGELHASDIKSKIRRRAARDFLFYDILKMK
jgi:geranylgeranyl reductase family protein